jgi:NAD(P)-dependent dehydrogenase (short-subunit alcohol dehydrogenase family)
MMNIRLDGQVAIVTGAGHGLGRTHALALAQRGARVVVNDLGGARDGTGGGSEAAAGVVAEILAAGGEAIASTADISDPKQVSVMVSAAMSAWGRIDILVNNAGILRDKSFLKMSLEDFRAVLEVHLAGSAVCTKAVWPIMREQAYGRILFTSSSSGIFGNFGQANYGAAKMGLVGLMNVLHLEGKKYDIRVNCLSPTAGTRMTEDIFPEEAFGLFAPELVSPAVVFLCGPDAPSRKILAAGAGSFAVCRVELTAGVNLGTGEVSPEAIAAAWAQIDSRSRQTEPLDGIEQSRQFAAQALQQAKSPT